METEVRFPLLLNVKILVSSAPAPIELVLNHTEAVSGLLTDGI